MVVYVLTMHGSWQAWISAEAMFETAWGCGLAGPLSFHDSLDVCTVGTTWEQLHVDPRTLPESRMLVSTNVVPPSPCAVHEL